MCFKLGSHTIIATLKIFKFESLPSYSIQVKSRCRFVRFWACRPRSSDSPQQFNSDRIYTRLFSINFISVQSWKPWMGDKANWFFLAGPFIVLAFHSVKLSSPHFYRTSFIRLNSAIVQPHILATSTDFATLYNRVHELVWQTNPQLTRFNKIWYMHREFCDFKDRFLLEILWIHVPYFTIFSAMTISCAAQDISSC